MKAAFLALSLSLFVVSHYATELEVGVVYVETAPFVGWSNSASSYTFKDGTTIHGSYVGLSMPNQTTKIFNINNSLSSIQQNGSFCFQIHSFFCLQNIQNTCTKKTFCAKKTLFLFFYQNTHTHTYTHTNKARNKQNHNIRYTIVR